MKLSKLLNRAPQPIAISATEPSQLTLKNAQDRYFRWLFDSKSDQHRPLSVPQKLVVEMVKNQLQKKDARLRAVPRLPTVIPKLLRSLRDPDSSVKDYVNIINKDPAMSVAVLKLANSVYFNPIGKSIGEVETAVVKLGIDGLHSVLSAAVMQPIIQQESAYFSSAGRKMWAHSLNCAVACELIAEHYGQEKFKMYLMGLTHDMGNITIFSELCKQFTLNGEQHDPGYHAFVPLMRSLSSALSFWIARDWELPQDICKAMAEQIALKPNRELSLYAGILFQANLITEVHATIYDSNERLAKAILSEMNLPSNLYDKLNQVALEM